MKTSTIIIVASVLLGACGHVDATPDAHAAQAAVDSYVAANQDDRAAHLRAYGHALADAATTDPRDARGLAARSADAARLETCLMQVYGPRGTRHLEGLRRIVTEDGDAGYWRYVMAVQDTPAIRPAQDACA